jgi:DNA-binding transcriptional LysR family regulator
LLNHNCIRFNFRRSRTGWPFKLNGRDQDVPVTGNIEVNNGESARQLVLNGAGIARIGAFHVEEDIAAGRLVEILQPFNPGYREFFHAVFIGGPMIPARVRVFIDYLAEKLA